MSKVFILSTFLLITSCIGLVPEWVLQREDNYFLAHTKVFWYFWCSCPRGVPDDVFDKLLSNDDGNIRSYQYETQWGQCNCTYFTAGPPGSEEACQGCASNFPVRGENRYLFVHSCYCNGCEFNESSLALQAMFERGDRYDDFYYGCDPMNPSKTCMCVTYSLRRGQELAGCNMDVGWFPCPSSSEEYEMAEASLDVYGISQDDAFPDDPLRR